MTDYTGDDLSTLRELAEYNPRPSFITDVRFSPDSVSLSPSTEMALNPAPFNYAPFLTLFGGGFDAASQFTAGRKTADFMRANAAIAGLQSQSTLEAGAEQAELYRQHLRAALGHQAANVGGSNVTMSGSALRGLETTSYLGAQDIARIQTNAARRAWGYQVTEDADLARAQMASRAGSSNALGTLITTGARAFGNWNWPS